MVSSSAKAGWPISSPVIFTLTIHVFAEQLQTHPLRFHPFETASLHNPQLIKFRTPGGGYFRLQNIFEPAEMNLEDCNTRVLREYTARKTSIVIHGSASTPQVSIF